MDIPISWDELFINMAKLVSKRSKDPSTKVGAILVSPDRKRVHIGYNGFPIGIEDTKERWKRPTKYSLVIHAEANAILNSKENLSGWSLYGTIPPCVECAKLIIQSDIKNVIYASEHIREGTTVDHRKSFIMLEEAGINCSFLY